ncbi:MAG: ankyrin repeat domain-containing protein [Phycisphaerales bacterium]|nr:MAG: ankyrin repeat domain-containing protein [Phycisphaerales bacterium]
MNRSVPAVLCVAAALALAGCESANDGSETADAQVAANKPAAAEPAQIPVEAKPMAEPSATPASSGPQESPASAGPSPEVDPADIVKSPERTPLAPPTEGPRSLSAELAGDDSGSRPGRIAPPPNQKEMSLNRPPTAAMTRNSAAGDASTSDAKGLSRVRDASFNPNAPPPNPEDLFVTVAPDKVELGEIATGDTGVGTVTLTNHGEVEVMPKAKSSCGCTTTGLKKGTVLKPGESIDVDIRLRIGQSARKLAKTVNFTFEPKGVHPPIRVPVSGEGKSFVTLAPTTIDPEKTDQARFVLKSEDDQPFRITSMVPGIIEEFPNEAKTEYEVTFSWDRWRELGQARKLMFYTDHPRCARVIGTVTVRRRAAAPPRDAEAAPQRVVRSPERPDAQRPPTPPPPREKPTVYEDLLKVGKGAEITAKVRDGLDPDTRDGTGVPLLGLAAQYGDLPLVQALIDAGADVDAVDTRTGRTPLMQAAEGNQVEAIRLLLNAGASLEAKNKIGGTALSWATGFGKAEAVRELIDQGAQIEVVDAVLGYTPLIWASGFGDPRSIGILLDAGANIEAAGMFEGATPLICAARTGKPEGLRVLIERGANLESAQLDGRTAFLVACAGSGGTAERVQILIDAGCNIHAKDNQGLGALDLARQRTDLNAPDVLELLERLFADSGE